MPHSGYWPPFLASIISASIAGSVFAQQSGPTRTDVPFVGNLVMPAVTPQQAERYLRSREVPHVDTVPTTEPSRQTNRSPLKLDLKTVLGHELPETDVTPYGLKRADFAIADPNAASAAEKVRSNVLAPAAAISPQAPVTIMQERPPEVGSPN